MQIQKNHKRINSSCKNAIESASGIAYPNALNLPIDESKIPSFVKPYIELTQKWHFLSCKLSKSEIRSINMFVLKVKFQNI